eukprot:c13319_g1_i2.p1 GENE.c13319_g1_i2~~c13319_g1_i2.p1  ORF type:complete len:498 (+),score=176.28 c13319_g1_i2:24-1517(+)
MGQSESNTNHQKVQEQETDTTENIIRSLKLSPQEDLFLKKSFKKLSRFAGYDADLDHSIEKKPFILYFTQDITTTPNEKTIDNDWFFTPFFNFISNQNTSISFVNWCSAFSRIWKKDDGVIEFIFDLFSKDEKIDILIVIKLFKFMSNIAEPHFRSKFEVSEEELNQIIQGMTIIRRPSSTDTLITKKQFESYIKSKSPRIFAPLELHLLVKFWAETKNSPQFSHVPTLFAPRISGTTDCNFTNIHCWCLSSLMPYPFDLAHKNIEQKSNQKRSIELNDPQSPWLSLYNSKSDAKSEIGFERAVEGYAGPSTFLIKTTKNEVFGAFVSQEWISNSFFGDSHCFLFRLFPTFEYFPSLERSESFVYLDTKSREKKGEAVNGVKFGGTVTNPRLWVNGFFDKGGCLEACRAYKAGKLCSTEEFEISAVEVWGCGDLQSFRRQELFRQNIEAEQDRRRKVDRRELLGESLQDNPDRVLLSFAGVTNYQNYITPHEEKTTK